MELYDDHVALTDTRQCAVEEQTVLEGLLKDVYLLCDEAPSRRRVFTTLVDGERVTEGELEEAINTLARRKLLLDLDGRFVSLADR